MMPRLLVFTALFAVLVCAAGPARAQTRPGEGAPAVWRPEAQAQVVGADTLLSFRTRRVPGGRFDEEAGVLRAAYRVGMRVAPGLSARAAARAFVEEASPRFGWTPAAEDLVLASVQTGRYSSHVTFQQVFHGLPVYHRQVKVNLDRAGQPTMVLSGYAPHLRGLPAFDPHPALTAEAAQARVAALALRGRVRTSTPELVVYPSKAPRLAWRMVAWPEAAPAEWEVLLDAHTGELLHLLDQSTHAHGGLRSPESGVRSPESEVRSLSSFRSSVVGRLSSGEQREPSVRGSGLVFDPDPLTSAGVPYEYPYTDNDDADIPELNDQRVEVPLYDLTEREGRYYLEGPYVRIVGDAEIGGTAYEPPAEANPDGFRYGRADDAFEAVMSYYHIDLAQRYLQTLDIGHPIQEEPVLVNPHGLGNWDDSKYYPGKNAIAFGTGGIDDAEDADVIWHEYAHALLEGSAPGLLASTEGQALHEGWADYWAASYSRGLMERGAVPEGDWQRVFPWDGNTEGWCGRRLDHPGYYPDGTAYEPMPGCTLPELYQRGLLWATTLMEIYTELGREVTDRLNLASHAYLGHPVTMQDAAETLIQADLDLHGGAHSSVLVERLGARGFVDPSDYGPLVEHEPLPSTEQLGGTVAVEVRASGGQAPVDSVFAFYRTSGTAYQRIVLAGSSGLYTGELPLPAASDTVFYYVEAVDELRQRTKVPMGAPSEPFRFTVGPDQQPPQLAYDALQSASLAGWPEEVIADAQDNLGVDTVWVSYRVEAPGGALQEEGAFGLSLVETLYRGLFPVDRTTLQAGSTIHYRLHARDIAAAQNEAVAPSAGTLAFELVETGVLRTYGMEGLGEGLTPSGVWTRGEPTYGLRVAHSGRQVWATDREGSYPAFVQQSSLEMRPLNLEGLPSAYLVLWHWYDLEESTDGSHRWDGANVKVSTDGGVSWEVLLPEGGYGGTIDSSYGNPLGGEPGYGGYSYGWQRALFPLPAAADVRLRFDLGTDESNSDQSLYFAGWYLDDLTITTERPQDTGPPVAQVLPPALMIRGAGEAPPTLVVQAEDDTGVAAVWAEYEVRAGDTDPLLRDTLRLAMSEYDRTVFRGALPVRGLAVGDEIAYHLRIVDLAGNERVYGAKQGEAFRIAYRLTDSADLLAGAVATGLWRQAGGAWGLTAGAAPDGRSSLIFEPLDLPANADALSLVLDHRYNLSGALGGNVKLSLDDGRTWSVLVPEEPYDAVYPQGGAHPMAGEAIFSGETSEFIPASFDLTDHVGEQVRLRIDFGSSRALEAGQGWTVQEARLLASTREKTFETPRTLALHPNFPDPFAGSTTLSYTVPEPGPVRLEVYDLLGRRIAVLVDEEQAAGTYTLTFDGSRLASGVYFFRMLADGTQKVEQMIIQQ